MMRGRLSDYLVGRDRGLILALIGAVTLLYVPFLGNGFFFDDMPFFFGGAAKEYAHAMFAFQLRWFPYSILGWIEAAFSNVATHLYHLASILLHIGNVLLLFHLLRVVSARLLSGINPSTIKRGAWLGALLFAVHPVAVYAAGYVVQLSILMATFFVLGMQAAYLRGLLSGQVRWLALSVLAYFLAVFSKEHSVMVLAPVFALTFLFRDLIRARIADLRWTWLALLAVGVLVVLRAIGVFGTPYEVMAGSLFEQQGIHEKTALLHILSVLTQAGLFFKYLLLWILPNPAWMSIDMREPFVASLGAWQGWLGGGMFALYGATGIWLLRQGGGRGLVGFALLYPWLQYFLEFSSIRVQEPFVLYRSYLWMPGLLLLIPLAVAKWPGRRVIVLSTLVVILMFSASINRLWVFADGYRLWDDAANILPSEHAPGADRIYFNRGQALEARGRAPEAIDDFKRSLAISPQYAPVHFELGWLYAVTKRFDEAMVEFDEAIRLDPKFANAYYGKGLILKMRHENAQAAAMMAKSCELQQRSIACLLAHGHVENQPSN